MWVRRGRFSQHVVERLAGVADLFELQPGRERRPANHLADLGFGRWLQIKHSRACRSEANAGIAAKRPVMIASERGERPRVAAVCQCSHQSGKFLLLVRGGTGKKLFELVKDQKQTNHGF